MEKGHTLDTPGSHSQRQRISRIVLGNMLRRRREDLGLGLCDFALKSDVLIALESGKNCPQTNTVTIHQLDEHARELGGTLLITDPRPRHMFRSIGQVFNAHQRIEFSPERESSFLHQHAQLSPHLVAV